MATRLTRHTVRAVVQLGTVLKKEAQTGGLVEGVECTASVGSTEVLTLHLCCPVLLSQEGALTLTLQIAAEHRTCVLSRDTFSAVLSRYLVAGLEETAESILLVTGKPCAVSEVAAGSEALVPVVGL